MYMRHFSLPRFLTHDAYGQVLSMLALFLLSSVLFRLAVYWTYSDDFSQLGAVQALEALLYGMRFDLSLAMLLMGPPLIFLLLPFAWSRHWLWHRFWLWLVFALLLVLSLMNAGDLLYFGDVHRHVGSEINVLSNDMPSMVRIALFNYPLALALFALASLSVGLAWKRLFRVVPRPPRFAYAHLGLLLLALFPMLVIARGGIGGKPISVGDAFFSGEAAQGHLALSGAFAISRAILESPPPSQQFMPEDQAIDTVQLRLGAGDRSLFKTPDYPLQRSFASPAPKIAPNVVVLMLESWGAQHIDALRTLRGGSALGITPHFDALAKTGRLYSRAYGNGQRSIQGASAILASQPTLSGLAFLGEGLEQNHMSFLGEIARSQGYETFFLQSSEGASLRFDAIAARAGFDHYRGAEDIPNLHTRPKPPATWGTWDHNTFQAANQQFVAAKKPFLGYVFTSTTHVPWMVPEDRFRKFSGSADVNAFHNSLFYADWALGQLMAAAKAGGYYDNTIFVLVADHTDPFVENAREVPNQYHIPLLFVGPGVTPGVDDRIASQLDILPTLIELCGWKVDYAGWGRSLLGSEQSQTRASFGVRGAELDWITADGWLSHNLERSTGQSTGLAPQRAAHMQKDLLATYQMASQLQTTNRVLQMRTKATSSRQTTPGQ